MPEETDGYRAGALNEHKQSEPGCLVDELQAPEDDEVAEDDYVDDEDYSPCPCGCGQWVPTARALERLSRVLDALHR